MRNYPHYIIAIGISIVILRGITNIDFVQLKNFPDLQPGLAWTDFVGDFFSEPTYTHTATARSFL